MASHEIPAASPSGSRCVGLRLAASRGSARALRGCCWRLERPAAVAAFGGYASVPIGLAARACALPLLVHEQNAVLGRANRLLLARRAGLLALSFAATAARAPRLRPRGSPATRCAPRSWRGASEPYRAPRAGEPLDVVVVGGSQGARVLSEVLPAAIAHLTKAERARIRLTQQCRPEDLERVAERLCRAGLRGRARELLRRSARAPRPRAAGDLALRRLERRRAPACSAGRRCWCPTASPPTTTSAPTPRRWRRPAPAG